MEGIQGVQGVQGLDGPTTGKTGQRGPAGAPRSKAMLAAFLFIVALAALGFWRLERDDARIQTLVQQNETQDARDKFESYERERVDCLSDNRVSENIVNFLERRVQTSPQPLTPEQEQYLNDARMSFSQRECPPQIDMEEIE